jgi:hypothetical protein
MSSSNSFQNLAPQIYKSILHPTTFILSFSLVYLHWEPCPSPRSSPRPFTSRLANRYTRLYFRAVRSIFPNAERLGVEIRSYWRVFFFNLAKKTRLGVGFGKSWRCSYDMLLRKSLLHPPPNYGG